MVPFAVKVKRYGFSCKDNQFSLCWGWGSQMALGWKVNVIDGLAENGL